MNFYFRAVVCMLFFFASNAVIASLDGELREYVLLNESYNPGGFERPFAGGLSSEENLPSGAVVLRRHQHGYIAKRAMFTTDPNPRYVFTVSFDSAGMPTAYNPMAFKGGAELEDFVNFLRGSAARQLLLTGGSFVEIVGTDWFYVTKSTPAAHLSKAWEQSLPFDGLTYYVNITFQKGNKRSGVAVHPADATCGLAFKRGDPHIISAAKCFGQAKSGPHYLVTNFESKLQRSLPINVGSILEFSFVPPAGYNVIAALPGLAPSGDDLVLRGLYYYPEDVFDYKENWDRKRSSTDKMKGKFYRHIRIKSTLVR